MPDPKEDEVILPWEAVKSPHTKEDYKRDARWFLEFAGFADPKKIHHKPGPDFAVKITSKEVEEGMVRLVEAFRKDPAQAKRLVIRFIREYNPLILAKKIGTTETRHRLRPIILACEMNAILLPWKKLMRLIESGRTTKDDREYRLEEIRLMLPRAWIQLQVAILFMCSAGVRVGAFAFLDVEDVRPVYRKAGEVVVPEPGELKLGVNGLHVLPAGAELLCGAMTVYSEEGGDEYDTLIMKEAYQKRAEYLEVRAREGQKITADSPAVVTRRAWEDEWLRWKTRGIANAISDLLWSSGLRTEKKRRHEVHMAHGFRKFYDNVAKDYIAEEYVEKLIGHYTGTKEHYDRHLPKPAVEQYLRAMPFLSIGEAYRNEAALTQRLEEVEAANEGDLKDMKLELLTLKDEKKGLEERLEKHDRLLEVLLKHPGVAELLKEHSAP